VALSQAAIAERPPVGLSTYGGLFFTTLTTLMYEVLLTRIFSVTMWYHFAFVAVSVALFGMTVGALLVYLSPQRFPHERTKERLSQASLLFSITIVLSFMTQLAIPFDPDWSVTGVYSAAFTYLVISVPFIFSGIVVSLVLTRFAHQVSRLYSADLVGAALGTITLIWLLDRLEDGPSAVLAVAALAAVGALFFAWGARRTSSMALAAAGVLVLFGLTAGNAVAAHNNDQFLRVTWAKGQSEPTPLFERWNSFSRIIVGGDPTESSEPWGWGLSSTLPDDIKVRQLVLSIDASAGTVLTAYDGTLGSIYHLKYDVTNLVHYIRPDADVFVIGSGGGRDVLSALAFDQRSVTAVEVNGDILEAVNGEFGDFTGHLDRRPGVRFVNDEARSYLARSDESFDIVQLALTDTWAATAAGAFALSENSLYTVDAWKIFFDRLSDDGVLSVSRWYTGPRPMEAYRLTSLAAETLREVGIDRPAGHLLMVRSPVNALGFGVGTLLLSKEPFSAADVARIEQIADLMRFEVVLAPGYVGSDSTFAMIADSTDVDSLPLGFPMDISAPTDDRPFFFQMIRLQDVFDTSLYSGRDTRFVTRPVLVLFSLSLAVIGLTALCILFPLARATSRQTLRGMLPLIMFFSSIGLGFMLLEISQLQRLTIFLGHPTYALSVVLFSLLLASGVGSLATERLVNPGLRPSLLLPFGVLLAVLVVSGFVTPAAVGHFEAATTPVRILTSALILAPMGLVMGMPFPIGMKVASLKADAPTPFLWGINGATSVCASVLAIAIALGWGISTAFWVGCVSYAAAAAALGVVALRRRL
jgi:spermidine synthase